MIDEQITKVDGRHVSGMDVSFSLPFTINVTAGSYEMDNREYVTEEVKDEDGNVIDIINKVEISTEVDEYPDFQFEVVPDSVFEVIYDCYLIDLPSKSGQIIHLDRTILSPEFPIAHYTGEDNLRLCLISVILPPNCTSLDDAEVRVNKVVRNDVGA